MFLRVHTQGEVEVEVDGHEIASRALHRKAFKWQAACSPVAYELYMIASFASVRHRLTPRVALSWVETLFPPQKHLVRLSGKGKSRGNGRCTLLGLGSARGGMG